MDADRLAPWYRWIEHAAFGRALEQSRSAFLHKLEKARRILVFGEGDGRALKELLSIAPAAEIDVVEKSARMIALAKERIGDSGRVRFWCQDARCVVFPEPVYDAVITFYFLDCFTEHDLRALLVGITPKLTPGAIWLVSEFAIPAAGWRRWHAQTWIWVMYRFFGLATGLRAQSLPPVDELLASCALSCVEAQARRWGMIVSQVWIAPMPR